MRRVAEHSFHLGLGWQVAFKRESFSNKAWLLALLLSFMYRAAPGLGGGGYRSPLSRPLSVHTARRDAMQQAVDEVRSPMADAARLPRRKTVCAAFDEKTGCGAPAMASTSRS